MPSRFALAIGFMLLVVQSAVSNDGLRFEVSLDPKLAADPAPSGRLVVALSKGSRPPRFTDAGPPGSPMLGGDVEKFTAQTVAVLDAKSRSFPAIRLADIVAGEYTVQAVFAFNPDLRIVEAPGNFYSAPKKVEIDPKKPTAIKITLDQVRAEPAPKESKTHQFLKLPSKLLSDFHGRPMFQRVGVVLPPKFDEEPDRKYGLVVHIGGFGQRFTSAARMTPDSRFVQLQLDGCGPYGDPYQVDSANNGPYGASLVKEVIPEIEKRFRCKGTPQSRFTHGGSTGGWVSLALQVFYPDFFNGCWSQCPDGVDFRAFQLVDVYGDANAYLNRYEIERAARRNVDGETVFTIRHECRLERLLGSGGNWELGGQQWASWNAVYSPKGSNGKPVPLWNGETGVIDREVAKQWEKYDLRLLMERNWSELGPKLSGKINIWVGDADDYFLNNAVHRLKNASVMWKSPPFDGRILIESRKGHGSGGWTRAGMLDQMAERMK